MYTEAGFTLSLCLNSYLHLSDDHLFCVRCSLLSGLCAVCLLNPKLSTSLFQTDFSASINRTVSKLYHTHTQRGVHTQWCFLRSRKCPTWTSSFVVINLYHVISSNIYHSSDSLAVYHCVWSDRDICLLSIHFLTPYAHMHIHYTLICLCLLSLWLHTVICS